MSNGKGTALVIVALVIGTAGLGVSTFSVIRYGVVEGPQGPQGPKGDPGLDGVNGTDGIDGINGTDIPNTYYCSSQQGIEEALINIETGNGQIFINGDIPLSSSIEINGGGNYRIQGIGDVTFTFTSSDELIVITDVQSLILQDFSIDTSHITSWDLQGINITEQDNDPIQIENVKIDGGWGRGIYVNSENVWIKNCLFTNMDKGIWLDSGSGYCHIIDNTLSNFGMSGVNPIGIYISDSSYNIISGNLIKDLNGYPGDTGIMYGFCIEGMSINNVLQGNILYDFWTINAVNAFFVGDGALSTIISDNIVYNIYSDGSVANGIYLSADACSITGNCFKIASISASGCYGIIITISGADNIITGNTIDVMTIANGIVDNTGGSNTIGYNTIY